MESGPGNTCNPPRSVTETKITRSTQPHPSSQFSETQATQHSQSSQNSEPLLQPVSYLTLLRYSIDRVLTRWPFQVL